MYPLIDTHAHFDQLRPDEKRAHLWANYNTAGIQQLIIPGTHPTQWPIAQEICRSNEGMYFSVGLHPWWLGDAQEDIKQLIQPYLSNKHCVAIGECGLDKTIKTPLTQQLSWFEWQLSLAQKYQLPIIIHSVKTHNEVIQQLKKINLECGGVIHGFSGSYQTAKTYWDMGFYLGIGGTITYPRAKKTRTAVCKMPIESLLLETDAPDMPLNGKQGQPNSSIYLPEIARCLADLRGVTEETIATTTTKSALTLFNKIHS